MTAASKNIVLLLVLGLIILSGCAPNERGESRIVYDRAGMEVVISRPINRIVSAAPSNTEIIVALGMAHKIVAIDRHSANVEGVPEGLPLLDFFFPDAEAIIALEPDIIIASGHNPTGSGDDPFRLLRDMGIAVAYISMSKSINDIYEDIAFIADLLQARQKGEDVINTVKTEIDAIRRRTAHIIDKQTVYFEIDAAPLMFTLGKDSFLDDMISTIGARNIFADDNAIISPSAESIITRNPDVILTNVIYVDDPIGEIKSRVGFEHISAVVNNRVYQIAADASSRPSPRIVYALRQMSHFVYPDAWRETNVEQ